MSYYKSDKFKRDRAKVLEKRKKDNADFIPGKYGVEFQGRPCEGSVQHVMGDDGVQETYLNIHPRNAKTTMMPIGKRYDEIDWNA